MRADPLLTDPLPVFQKAFKCQPSIHEDQQPYFGFVTTFLAETALSALHVPQNNNTLHIPPKKESEKDGKREGVLKDKENENFFGL